MDQILLKARQLLKVDPTDLVHRIRERGQRSCLAYPRFKALQGYGDQFSISLEPPSSDEESVDSEFPSVKRVTEVVLDSSQIEVRVTFS